MWILLENKHLFKGRQQIQKCICILTPFFIIIIIIFKGNYKAARERVHLLYVVSVIDPSSSLLAGGDLSVCLSLNKAKRPQ